MPNQPKFDVIKIGGSVLFDKQGQINIPHTKLLLELVSRNQNSTILVIGCGEYLHTQVLNASLTDRYTGKPNLNRIATFFDIYNKIDENLNIVVNLLPDLKKFHPTQTFVKKSEGQPGSEITWKNLEIEKTNHAVISGGVILDENILFAAISSDTIASYLACNIPASRLILISDTDGIYPSLSDQTTIPEVSISHLAQIDLAGGMKDKLRRITPAVTAHIPTFITNGSNLDHCEKILLQNDYTHATSIIN